MQVKLVREKARQMAERRVVEKCFTVTVFDVQQEPLRSLQALGARVVNRVEAKLPVVCVRAATASRRPRRDADRIIPLVSLHVLLTWRSAGPTLEDPGRRRPIVRRAPLDIGNDQSTRQKGQKPQTRISSLTIFAGPEQASRSAPAHLEIVLPEMHADRFPRISKHRAPSYTRRVLAR